MIYRTLHTYILRELLRVFLLTAMALTTLLAFGGTFKPLTKQGMDIQQLLVIVLNLMPAMLAYAIPTAALFAAVLVYWRMSTDNELTACRAGGVSFISIVLPAFVLGLAVASVDLVFVNYVVPQFLQSTERIVRGDLGSLIVSQINRQERFSYGKLVVWADSANLQPEDPNDPNLSVVELHGMAGALLENGKTTATVVAQTARVRIHNLPAQDSAELEISLENASGFEPGNAFRKVTTSVTQLSPDGRPLHVESYFKSKPKFLNWRDLQTLGADAYLFPPVADVIDQIEQRYKQDQISRNVQAWWVKQSRSGAAPVVFKQNGDNGPAEITLYATGAKVDPTKPAAESLIFTGPVKVEQRAVGAGGAGGKLQMTYTADKATMVLAADEYGGGVSAQLQIEGNVTRQNHAARLGVTSVAVPVLVSGVILAPALKEVPPLAEGKAGLLTIAANSPEAGMRGLSKTANIRIGKLFQQIGSELHSRGSFSLSCLTLVMLGAALGIMLRGKNPLAVFVIGFVPAVFLVLLITAGRELAEGDAKNVSAGIALIWAGNAVLLALVAGVYAKLLRS